VTGRDAYPWKDLVGEEDKIDRDKRFRFESLGGKILVFGEGGCLEAVILEAGNGNRKIW